MRVPAWLTLGVAAIVICFGAYRISLALRKRPADGEAGKRPLLGGGFYQMSPRTHVLVGVVYLMLGGALVATSFGWNPFGTMLGPATATPSKDKAPAKNIPIDTVAPAK